MKIGLLSIGDELLIGQVVNTNASWLAEQLTLNGFIVNSITTVGDIIEDIVSAIAIGLKHSDTVIITGGLGPTSDDRTRAALCSLFACGIKSDPESVKIITDIFLRRGLPVTEINLKQAEVPEACVPISNPIGTSPGMWFDKDEKILIAMPGVPFETKHMFMEAVLPRLLEKFSPEPVIYRNILTQGLGESFLADKIKDWETNLPNCISLAYLPQPGIVQLRLKARGCDPEKLEDLLDEQIDKLYDYIPDLIFGFEDDTLQSVVGELLAERNLTVSTAESCTGGYIAHLITSVPGSSRYYKGTIVAYDNIIKINELNVQRSLLEQYGVVSQEIVMLMAKGIKRKYKTDYSIAVTGIAGPDGGTPDKPVGTVWIAIAGPNGINTVKENFGSDRERNIRRTALAAINMLRKELLETE